MSEVKERKVWADPETAKARIAELEDKLQKATDNYDSACRQISFMAERMERFETLQAELTALREGLNEAMSWNWLDDDMNDEVANRLAALLQERGE